MYFENNYMMYEHKICNEKNLKRRLFKHLIILLCLMSTNPSIIPGNVLKLLSINNVIILKIKKQGKNKIINPSCKFKPSFYYLNNFQIPTPFQDSEIELTESENIIALIFGVAVTNCDSMFSGCSNITEIDLSYFNSSNVNNINSMFNGCTSLKSIKFGNFQSFLIKWYEFCF